MKKYILLVLLSAISYSYELHGVAKVGYEKEIQGRILSKKELNDAIKKGINAKRFIIDKDEKYKDKNINKITYYDVELSNGYLTLGARQLNDSILLKSSIQSANIFGDLKSRYEFSTNIGDDKINYIKAGTMTHKLNLWYKDKVDFKFLYDNMVNEEELYINLKYFNIYANRLQIHEKEASLKNMSNLQNFIANSDDGHGHNGSQILHNLSSLPFDFKEGEIKYGTALKFNNVEYNVGIYKEFIYNKTNLGVYANYKNKKAKHYFVDKLSSDIQGQEFLVGIKAEKYFVPKLKTAIDVNIEHLKYTEDKKSVEKTKFAMDFLKNDIYKGIIKNKYNLNTEIAYTFNPIDKLDITLGMKNNFSLISYRNIVDDEQMNRRKKAAEGEIERAKKERERLGENAVEKLEKEAKELKSKLLEKEEKLNKFDNKRDFTNEINSYDDRGRFSALFDMNEMKNEYKKIIEGKSFSEIDEFFASKAKEKEELEGINGISKRESIINFRIDTNKNKEENINKLKAEAEKKGIKNSEAFAKQYFEIYKYQPQGIFGSIKSYMLNERSILQREFKSAKRSYEDKINSIIPDESVLSQYEVLYNQTQTNYLLRASFNPYVDLNYAIYKGLSLNAKMGLILELEKDFGKKINMTNHLHINGVVGIKYEF